MALIFWMMSWNASVNAELSGISAEAYILLDADSGQVLEAKNEHTQLPPASMTKLMTLILALEALDEGKVKPEDQVRISGKAVGIGGSQIFLAENEMMSYQDLLISIAVGSANDSCVAVAEYLAGSEENFIQAMNAKTVELGLQDTHFANTNGLPVADHYSSAHDMAMLGYYALKSSRVLEYTSIKEYTLREGNFELHNTNQLLWWYEGADGLKTGWTTEAKYCLTATAKRDELRLISTVMGSPQPNGQFQDSIQLLNYGFDHYGFQSFFIKDSVAANLPVGKGNISEIEAVAAGNVGMLYRKDEDNAIRYELSIRKKLNAPIVKGEKLGDIIIYNHNSEYKRVDLLAGQSVARGGIGRQILKMFGKTYLI